MELSSSEFIRTCEVEAAATVSRLDSWTERIVTAQCRGIHCVGTRTLISVQEPQTAVLELEAVLSAILVCSEALYLAPRPLENRCVDASSTRLPPLACTLDLIRYDSHP